MSWVVWGLVVVFISSIWVSAEAERTLWHRELFRTQPRYPIRIKRDRIFPEEGFRWPRRYLEVEIRISDEDKGRAHLLLRGHTKAHLIPIDLDPSLLEVGSSFHLRLRNTKLGSGMVTNEDFR